LDTAQRANSTLPDLVNCVDRQLAYAGRNDNKENGNARWAEPI
jgi:hypothetical protein